MGWLGWTGTVLVFVLAAVACLVFWATTTNSVLTLDRVDYTVSRNTARLAASGRYGDDPQQKARLYVPTAPAPAGGYPLVAFYHGGSWQSGDPDEYGFLARRLGAEGYATALIGYRLGENGRFPKMLEDSAAGLRWALGHASAHHVDPARVVLIGHSAGAYNAAMLTLDQQWLGPDRARLAGMVGLAGPYDFYPFRWDSARLSFGSWPDPQATQPIGFARKDAAPLLLLTGTADQTVRPRNSAALAKAMAAAGGRAELVEIAGMTHGGPIITLARPFDRDRRVADALFGFLAKVLPASSPVQPAPS